MICFFEYFLSFESKQLVSHSPLYDFIEFIFSDIPEGDPGKIFGEIENHQNALKNTQADTTFYTDSKNITFVNISQVISIEIDRI